MTKVLKIDGRAVGVPVTDDTPVGDVVVKKSNGFSNEPTYFKIGQVELWLTENDIPDRIHPSVNYVEITNLDGITMNKTTLMTCLRALANAGTAGSKIEAIKLLR